jgi:riboflavin kinase/FMN adenylyltransferase
MGRQTRVRCTKTRAVTARRVEGASALAAAPRSTLVVIGNFDGVHRGHQAVLASAAEESRDHGLLPVVLTFDPHPVVVLGKGAPSVLTTMERRIELIGRELRGVTVVVQPFTVELSEIAARAFVEGLLLGDLGASRVVVGENFCFGKGRKGDVALLQALGAELGFHARAHTLEGDGAGSFSSSRVRAAIEAGEVAEAARMLGRPHSLSGRVVRGDARGRQLGFPTANLADVAELSPANGVYACLVDRLGTDASARVLGPAVINVGVRPTVGAGRSVEVHVMDFDGELYEERLRVHLVARLREERRFAGLAALTEQIRADVAQARRLLASATPDPAANGAWA